jgi:transposase
MVRTRQGAQLDMSKMREILRLHELSYSQCEIARSCRVARSTVQDYLRRATAKGLSYSQLVELSDSAILAQLGKGKAPAPSPIAEARYGELERELSRKGMTLALLWQEGIDRAEWHCSYGTFCRHYKQWRGRHNLSMRQVYEGGDKVFVDYCGPTVLITPSDGGATITAQIFVACLGASNYTFAEATASQCVADWIGSHQRAFVYFGGVPKCVVPDNLKAGVTQACHYEPGVNRQYQEWAAHYGVAVVPARPHKPRDKAKVEKAVQEVERQILAPLRDQRFTSLNQLNAAIRRGLTALNQRLMRDYSQTRQERFAQVDKPALRPLPTQAFEVATWKQAKVSLDYHIDVGRHFYSVPYAYVKTAVQVKITPHLVEVFADNQRIALHERNEVAHRHSTLPEHMPPEHWAYKHQSKQKFLTWATQNGPHTLHQVETLFAQKAYEEQAFRSIKGVQSLATHYGAARLEAACRRANALGMCGYRRLKTMLKAQLEDTPLEPDIPHTAPQSHDNLRGSTYFQ